MKADQNFGRWLAEEAAEFITKPDKCGKTPLHEAFSIGAAWFIEAILVKHPANSSFYPNSHLPWIKACEKGHVLAIRTFVDYDPGKFRDVCIDHMDSPLHHIHLPNLMGCEEFLNFPRMKDLINVQDFHHGETPLHKAIRNEDILLAEALLNMDKIKYNIKDHENVTSIELLEQLCEQQPKWVWFSFHNFLLQSIFNWIHRLIKFMFLLIKLLIGSNYKCQFS